MLRLLKNKNFVLSLVISIFSLILDQMTKFIILENIINLQKGLEVISILNLVYVENRGVSFGLFSEYNIPFFLGILSFLISLYIIFLICKSNNRMEIVGLSLILGGAVGNGVDRLFNGYVIDFIDIHYKSYHWPVFNLADTFITIGALIFFVNILVFQKK